MTHGEDAGPETHQDSAVLTYLEGLLMHPVATGPGATATRRIEADRNGNEEQRRNHAVAAAVVAAAATVAQGSPLANRGPAVREKASPPGGGTSQHLKKARLLRSGAWGEAEPDRRKSPSVASLNGHLGVEEKHQLQQQQQRPGQDGSSLGESTLLASLLTTFSSRLQGVAMSQSHSQSPKQPEAQNGSSKSAVSPDMPQHDHNAFQGYDTASSRLKGLVRKSKGQSHHTSGLPYSQHASQDRFSESPCSDMSAAAQSSPSDSGVSCAERLKAVANLVKTRSSPAPSPRPSMACSQLALLLSSEAHLKQYSREQVLKAQLAGQSASERLAAIASQKVQDKRPPSTGESRRAPDTLSPLNGQSRTSPLASASSTMGSPSLSSAHSSGSISPRAPLASPQPLRERRHFDRHGSRPPQSCSSLLLLLLNNHKSQKHLTRNGHLADEEQDQEGAEEKQQQEDNEGEGREDEEEEEEREVEERHIRPSQALSLPLDTRVLDRVSVSQLDKYHSPTKSCSDGDSYYSSCSPIDLSMRSHRVFNHESAPSSSSSNSLSTCPLDKLTETLLNRWKPDTPGAKVSEAMELDVSLDSKSHHKVTLMQLLLDRQNNEKVNKVGDNPDLRRRDTTLSNVPTDPLKLIGSPYTESLRQSPVDYRVSVGRSGTASFSLNGDMAGSPPQCSQVQSSPLDLCKAKSYSGGKGTESGFSASKLLQNLAQCGHANSSPSPASPRQSPPVLNRRPNKRPSPELLAEKPSALLECLNPPPTQRNSTPLVDPSQYSSFTPQRRELSVSAPASATSQIESLLERRTVLQLLLGSTSNAEKPGGAAGSSEMPQPSDHSEKHSPSPNIQDFSNGPPLEINIKTEPEEDQSSHFTSPSHNDYGVYHWNHGHYGRHGSPPTKHQGDVKSEPCPDDVVSKYGLLSQLLRQQTSTYKPGTPSDYSSKTVKEEQQDYQSGPSPKRRRLCLELAEQLTSELCSRPVDSYEGLGGKLLLSPKREESPARSPGQSKVLPRDHQGFNVLKQLLLSDNCLKGLSKGSGVPSPGHGLSLTHGKANGSILPHHAHSNHKLSQSPWHPASPSPKLTGASTASSQHLVSTSGNGLHHGFLQNNAVVQTTATTTTTTATATLGSVKQECESTGWEAAAEGANEQVERDERDCSPDSPRLTRANPILYYMLQRGKGGLRGEPRDQRLPTAHCEIKVKQEPMVDEEHSGGDGSEHGHRLSSSS